MTDKFQDQFLFHQGTSRRAYEYMGMHREGDEAVFRVWAPNAEAAYVVGGFNGWSDSCPMKRITERGIWEARVPSESVRSGDMYKYKLINRGRVIFKADPYGIRLEAPPNAASVVYDMDGGYDWHDEGWLEYRRELMGRGCFEQPINIYEIHLGSWKRHSDGSYFSYKELADDLAPYVKQMGYTHVELLPVAEHPFDGSWGYQVGGYYAPTTRFGTPYGLMNFIDIMHTAGIGVILDWVPAHFVKDDFGLYEFDGQPLYEYQGKDRMEHRGWGTRCFDVGREEVQSFLVSNAFYWVDKYHADGIRVDAVASMLYLDYDKLPDEWVPNVYGDNRNLEAMAFFKKLNAAVDEEYPDVLMIAEESGSQIKLTGFEDGGLGFDMKWNMGWMNDTLSYAEFEPIYRSYHHDKLTFPLMYAFSERFLLPISHDEVVHGKKSFVDKMPGDYWRKFAGARVFYAWQMTHPGKKLTFMGNEIAQFKEWDHDSSVEWFMLDYDMHAKYQLYCAQLNHFYLAHPELWQVDSGWDGFQWINADDSQRSILSFRRIRKDGEQLYVVLNFTPNTYEDFALRVEDGGEYTELFNSDSEIYGGSGVTNAGATLYTYEMNGSYDLKFRMPPLGAVILGRDKTVKPAPEKKKSRGRKKKSI